jgi:hypothetical protein
MRDRFQLLEVFFRFNPLASGAFLPEFKSRKRNYKELMVNIQKSNKKPVAGYGFSSHGFYCHYHYNNCSRCQ